MAHILNETQSLYVLSEDCCRGDVSYNKTKVLYLYVKAATNFAIERELEDIEEQLDDFFAIVPDQNVDLLSAIVDSRAVDLIGVLQEKGKYTIQGEESTYGIGITKELATEAYLEQFPLKIDNWK